MAHQIMQVTATLQAINRGGRQSMEGYFLFRGDILVAGKPDDFSAAGLWDQGMEGDILVSPGTLGANKTMTFRWVEPGRGSHWTRIHLNDPERYRVLILLQQ